MSTHATGKLIGDHEPPPVDVSNESGRSRVVLVCEHASNRIPDALNALGLDEETASSHAAWDPGALGVAQHLSAALNATLVAANYSRLVCDLNRPLDSPDAFRDQSEVHRVPGNEGLSDDERLTRAAVFYEPFHTAVQNYLDARSGGDAAERLLVTIHSFTPVYFGKKRDAELGILHSNDSRLADILIDLAPSFAKLDTQRNQPYGPEDGVTHTLEVHALPRGMLNVMIEIRNDLIETSSQQKAVADQLAALFQAAILRLETSDAA